MKSSLLEGICVKPSKILKDPSSALKTFPLFDLSFDELRKNRLLIARSCETTSDCSKNGKNSRENTSDILEWTSCMARHNEPNALTVESCGTSTGPDEVAMTQHAIPVCVHLVE